MFFETNSVFCSFLFSIYSQILVFEQELGLFEFGYNALGNKKKLEKPSLIKIFVAGRSHMRCTENTTPLLEGHKNLFVVLQGEIYACAAPTRQGPG